LNPGRGGVLGLGGEAAEIEVTVSSVNLDIQSSSDSLITEKDQNKNSFKNEVDNEIDEETEKLAVEIMDFLISSLGVSVNTYLREENEENGLYFEIEGDDAGLIIGRKGETLRAMQFLMILILKRQLGKSVRITLDVEGYRDRRISSLEVLAENSASKVKKSGKPFRLNPMSAFERRVIHVALAENRNVRTESKGSGLRRQVVIFPVRD
tara:strand:+ start:261 stop:887 length:627 start_codon:yes stop_codon:yes gene_type:complete